jgi:hypothetical protein
MKNEERRMKNGTDKVGDPPSRGASAGGQKGERQSEILLTPSFVKSTTSPLKGGTPAGQGLGKKWGQKNEYKASASWTDDYHPQADYRSEPPSARWV